jgi:hypothetical protein
VSSLNNKLCKSSDWSTSKCVTHRNSSVTCGSWMGGPVAYFERHGNEGAWHMTVKN